MKTKEFLKKHDACKAGAKWALSIGDDMADVWDAMIERGRHDWLIWTATRPGVFSDSILRKLACRFIRETPLHDGRKVWDLLTDERSRKALEVAEFYADGKATNEELEAACNAAARAAADVAADAGTRAAVRAAYAAADVAAYAAADVAYDAARAARDAAADVAAYAAADVAADVAVRAAAYAAAAAARAAVRAAYAAARAAQIKMIAELGNPFK